MLRIGGVPGQSAVPMRRPGTGARQRALSIHVLPVLMRLPLLATALLLPLGLGGCTNASIAERKTVESGRERSIGRSKIRPTSLARASSE